MKSSKNFILAMASTLVLTNFCFNNSFAESANVKQVEITADEINILADIAAIDKEEILLAAIASNKKSSSDVMNFAKMMSDQHGSNLTQLLEIANTLHIQSLSSEESNQLIAHGNQAMMKLGGLQGEQFDKAYIDGMIKGHQGALGLIDNKLMKAAKTEAIKSFLTDTRAAVVQHLEHAKKVQESKQS